MTNLQEEFIFITQFIPISLTLLYIFDSSLFYNLSHTYLGRFISILIVCLYTYKNVFLGVFICLIVILYYHQQIESFLSLPTINYYNFVPKESKKKVSSSFQNNYESDLTEISKAYPEKLKPIKKVSEFLFRKDNCKNKKLAYKNQNVKNEMIPHVFQEFQFNRNQCNPCAKTCHFTIDMKQKIESQLEPINSHTTMLEDVLDLFGKSKPPLELTSDKNVVSQYIENE